MIRAMTARTQQTTVAMLRQQQHGRSWRCASVQLSQSHSGHIPANVMDNVIMYRILPKISPSPPFQQQIWLRLGRGLIFEYAQYASNISPPTSRQHCLLVFSAHIILAQPSTQSSLDLSLQHSSKNWRYHCVADSTRTARQIAAIEHNFELISMLYP